MLTSLEPCVLGLDVSTSVLGWSLVALESEKFSLGYLPLVSSKDVFCKALEVRKLIQELAQNYDIRAVYVEEDLQRFRSGMSSARTLSALTRFNGAICQICFEVLDLKPIHVNVNSARKLVGIRYDRKDKSRTVKEKVFEKVDELIQYDWPTKILKSGPRKGLKVFQAGCYDAADAWVIATAGKKLYLKSLKQ